ncbi:AAA family ATPase [Limibacter armeniacum]|uniref:AAA family ATPase n=1 Tax=Limibacter armeniacum TaxID=466084 RepID=UPI002FE55556
MNQETTQTNLTGKDQALQELLQAYQQLNKSETRHMHMAFVSGYLGMGKSTLLKTFKEEVAHEALIIEGKFSTLHQGIPYYGFKEALANHIHQLITHQDNLSLEKLEGKLTEKLGSSLQVLTDYIPELSMLIKHTPAAVPSTMAGVENQLYPLIKSLLDVFFDFSERPCVFLFDDLQWMDPSSTNLLKYLAFNSLEHKVLVIGAYRKNEVSKGHPVMLILKDLKEEKMDITEVEVKTLNAADIIYLIESAFPEGKCTKDFAQTVFKLTQGHPFYVKALLKELKNSHFIWVENGYWQTNAEAIQSRFKDMNIFGSVQERLVSVAHPTKMMLKYMSCMGQFNLATLCHLLDKKEKLVTQLVGEAMSKGLLAYRNREIAFAEGYYAEIIYNTISVEQRVKIHYNIADFHYKRHADKLVPSELIFITNHYNEALPVVKQRNESVAIARLNLKAGNASRRNQALEIAIKYYNTAADLLKETTKPEEHSELKAQIQLEKARCEYRHGNFDLAEIHLDRVLQQNTNVLLRARAYQQKITINIHTRRYRNAIEILQKSLSDFDISLPLSEKDIVSQLQTEELQLNRFTDENGVDAIAACSNRENNAEESAILNLLHAGTTAIHHYSSNLLKWQAMFILNLAIRTRPTGITAMACVTLSKTLIGTEQSMDIALAFGELGFKLGKQVKDSSLYSQILGHYAYFVQSWKAPLRKTIPNLENSIQKSLQQGDGFGADMLTQLAFDTKFQFGYPLFELLDTNPESPSVFQEKNAYIIEAERKLIRKLSGVSTSFNLRKVSPKPLGGRFTFQEQLFFYYHVRGLYYLFFDMHEQAMLEFEAAHTNSALLRGSPRYAENIFMMGLSTAINYINIESEKREEALEKLYFYKSMLWRWSENAPENFSHKYHILSAELFRISGEKSKALHSYKLAAKEAFQYNYIQHEAIANLRMSTFMLTEKYPIEQVRQKLTKSIRCFNSWGAKAKVTQLQEKYAYLLKNQPEPPQHRMEEIEHVQQEVGAELDEQSTIKKMLSLLLTAAAASRCLLFFRKGEDIMLVGEARSTDHYLKAISKPTPIKDTQRVSHSVLRYCIRSQQTLMSSHPSDHDIIRERDYILQQGIQSLLCIPIIIHDELTGLVYLENNYATDIFTHGRQFWTGLIARQGGINLEKARIHQQSVALNKELKQEMIEKERLHKLIEEQKNTHINTIVETQESERKRIAEDLHDSLGALLGSVKLHFTHFQENFEEKIPEKQQEYEKALALLDNACQEVRRISHNMLPSSLIKFGLVATLGSFLQQVEASSTLQIDFSVYGLDERLSQNIEVAVYRICLELVQNVIKHAQASQLNMQLIRHEDSLNIIVEDDGKGFDPTVQRHGIGLENLASRVDYLKGDYSIDSQIGSGTSVIVDIPL